VLTISKSFQFELTYTKRHVLLNKGRSMLHQNVVVNLVSYTTSKLRNLSVDHSVRDVTRHSLWNILYQLSYRKHVQYGTKYVLYRKCYCVAQLPLARRQQLWRLECGAQLILPIWT